MNTCTATPQHKVCKCSRRIIARNIRVKLKDKVRHDKY